MRSTDNKATLAKALISLAKKSVIIAANSRCAFIYHQPKQPLEIKKFRRF
jgi:cyclic lactone autoinducer peptide